MSLSASRKFQLGVLTLGHMLVDMYGGFYAPLMPALEIHLGLRYALLSGLAMVASVLVNGIQPLAGMVIHRFRFPYLLVLGPLFAALVGLIGLVPGFWLLSVVVLLCVMGVGSYHPEGLMAAHVVSGDKDDVGVPIFLSGGFFGYSLGALVATEWVSRLGFGTFAFLMIPGGVFLLLFAFSGLGKVACEESRGTVGEKAEAQAPSFWPLLVLASFMAMAAALLYTFLTTYLVRQFGKPGLVIGGRALFILGLSSAFSSFGWGYLSRRVHTFAMVAVGQLVCLPVFIAFVLAPTPARVLLLSLVLGPLMGFYPLVATMARRARGLTPGVRSGLIVGGAWLIAGLPIGPFGWLIDQGVPVRDLLLACALPMLLAGLLAVWLYVATARRSA